MAINGCEMQIAHKKQSKNSKVHLVSYAKHVLIPYSVSRNAADRSYEGKSGLYLVESSTQFMCACKLLFVNNLQTKFIDLKISLIPAALK